MEFEIEEKFVEHDQRSIHTQLSTSTDFVNFKNEPVDDKSAMELQFKIEEESVDYKEMKNEPEDEDGSAMEVKVETKEEFARDVEGCIEPHLIMSLDLKNLNNEQCEDNLGLSHKNRMEIMKILPEDSFNKNQISPDYEEVPINNLNGHVNMKTEEGPEKNKCEICFKQSFLQEEPNGNYENFT
uniref:Uncharacterized protein LOC114331252 isoform X1 n=1 Tax=Diabrotica virgifera virgifera TaxID=50390 RepID=A0A6P7FK91_DIAVI